MKEPYRQTYWVLGYLTSLRLRISEVVRTLEAMPWILRTACIASFLTGIVIVLTNIFPVSGMRINDESLSTAELWEKGYSPLLLVMGTAMTIAGIGIFRRWGWSRWIVVLLYAFTAPIEYIYSQRHPNTTTFFTANLVSGVAWAVFFYWYLFHKQRKAFT